MTKKTVLSFFCATMLLLSSTTGTACSGGNTEGNKPTYDEYDITDNMLGEETGTVTFAVGGGNNEVALWNSIKKDFESKNPGCTLKLEFIAGDATSYASTIYNKIASGVAADVVQVEVSNFGKWARSGAIKGLGRFIEEESQIDGGFRATDYYDTLIEDFSYSRKTKLRGNAADNENAELYCVPKDLGIIGVYVNVDLFKKYNIELPSQEEAMTWDEYFALAKRLNDMDTSTGVNHVYGTSPIDWQIYALSLGTSVLKDGNKYLNADDENLIKAMQTAANIQRPDNAMWCAPSLSEVKNGLGELTMFRGGKLCMYWGGRWNAPSLDVVNFDYMVIPIPSTEKGGVAYVPGASMGYGITRCTKNAKLAWKLLKYLSSADGYRHLATTNYGVAGLKSLATDPDFTDPTRLCPDTKLTSEDAKVFIRQANYLKTPYEALLTSQNWVNIFDQKAELLWNGTKSDARAVLIDMESLVNNAIRNNEPQLFT